MSQFQNKTTLKHTSNINRNFKKNMLKTRTCMFQMLLYAMNSIVLIPEVNDFNLHIFKKEILGGIKTSYQSIKYIQF